MTHQPADLVALTKNLDLLAVVGRSASLRKVAANEYAGPCPKCGGTDRFHLHTGKGWFCRRCTGADKWHDAIDFRRWMYGETFARAVQALTGGARVDPAELERIQREREAAERLEAERQQSEQAAARERLAASGLDLTYHANLNIYPEARELWRKRGIPDDWQDYYKFGYCPPREWGKGAVCASLTIPFYRHIPGGGRDLVSLRHRLLGETPGGKYRPEFSGLGNQLYFPWPEESLDGEVLIVEGEIKAAVTFRYLWQGDDPLRPCLNVVGVSGAAVKPALLREFENCTKIHILLDPDADQHAKTLAAALGGERCRILRMPGKIDDLLTAGVIDGLELIALLEAEE